MINEFEVKRLNGFVLDMKGLERQAYDMYDCLLKQVPDNCHKCIGCPVVRKAYNFNTIDIPYNQLQEECCDDAMECTNMINVLDGCGLTYNRLLSIAEELES